MQENIITREEVEDISDYIMLDSKRYDNNVKGWWYGTNEDEIQNLWIWG